MPEIFNVDVLLRVRQEGIAAFKETEGALASLNKAALVSAGVLGGALAVGFGESIKMAGDFQKSMTELVTGAGEAESNIKMVGDGILKMSGQVGISAAELSKGMYMIESAGFHGAAGLEVLKVASEGAAVGGAHMETVANAVTSALNAYHLPASEATHVTNDLIATVANGKMHMEDLAGAISHVLPAASAAHISLAEVSGAMATLTMSGTPAADAATYLRQTILNLANPLPKARTEMEALGLSAIDVASHLGERGLTGTLTMLTDAIARHTGTTGTLFLEHLKKASAGSSTLQQIQAKMPATEQTYVAALANMVGGTKSMQAALQLTGDGMAVFKGNVDKITEAVRKGGSNVEGWALVQKDFNFQMERAKAGAEAAAIQLGTAFLPAMTQLAQMAADNLVPALKATVAGLIVMVAAIQGGIGIFNVLGTIVHFVVSNFGFFGPVLGIATAALIAWNVGLAIHNALAATYVLRTGFMMIASSLLAGHITLVTVAQWLWNVAMTANPIGVVVMGIAILIAGIVLLVTHWKQVIEWVTMLWNLYQTFMETHKQLAVVIFALTLPIQAVIIAVRLLHDNWSEVMNFMGAALNILGSTVNSITSWIGNQFNQLGTGLAQTGQAIGNVFNTIGTFASNMRDAVGAAFSALGGGVHNGLRLVADVVVSFDTAADNLPVIGGMLNLPKEFAFARGGIVPGMGSGDTVPAMLTPGEVVLNRSAVGALGGPALANGLNQMGAAGTPGSTVGSWGGQCVAEGTLISTERGDVPIEEVCVGERVWTRQGLKPVLEAALTRRNARVLRLQAGGREVVVTPGHRLWAAPVAGGDRRTSFFGTSPVSTYESLLTRDQSAAATGARVFDLEATNPAATMTIEPSSRDHSPTATLTEVRSGRQATLSPYQATSIPASTALATEATWSSDDSSVGLVVGMARRTVGNVSRPYRDVLDELQDLERAAATASTDEVGQQSFDSLAHQWGLAQSPSPDGTLAMFAAWLAAADRAMTNQALETLHHVQVRRGENEDAGRAPVGGAEVTLSLKGPGRPSIVRNGVAQIEWEQVLSESGCPSADAEPGGHGGDNATSMLPTSDVPAIRRLRAWRLRLARMNDSTSEDARKAFNGVLVNHNQSKSITYTPFSFEEASRPRPTADWHEAQFLRVGDLVGMSDGLTPIEDITEAPRVDTFNLTVCDCHEFYGNTFLHLQCVVFVENMLGTYWPVAAAAELTSYINSQVAAPGEAAVFTAGPYGHVALLTGAGDQQSWPVIDSNWVAPETIGVHTMSRSDYGFAGFINTGSGLPGGMAMAPGASTGASALAGAKALLDGLIDKAMGNLGDWEKPLAKGLLDSIIKGAGSKLGFEHGGIVPGPLGAPMNAVVHGGETITPPGKMGGHNITINNYGQVALDPVSQGDLLIWKLKTGA